MKITVNTTDGEQVVTDDGSFHLDTDDGVLIVTGQEGEAFFNWDNVSYFITEGA